MGSEYCCEDIIRDILLRLSPKSLLRFKAVCKQWSALITSSNFVSIHHQRRPKHSIMLTYRVSRTNYALSLFADDGSTSRLDDRSMRLPSMLFKYDMNSVYYEGKDIKIIGSCNGLLCLSISFNDYFLLNPATRECRPLPSPHMSIVKEYHKNHVASGFGFHGGKIKLLRVVQLLVDKEQNFVSEAEVFEMSTGCWTQVEDANRSIGRYHLRTTRGSTCNAVVVNGVWYHSSFDSPINKTLSILTFDMGANVFSKMKETLPNEDLTLSSVLNVNLMEYKGLLAAVVDIERKYLMYEIWTILENDVWTKLIVFRSPIVTFDKHIKILGIWKDEEIILRETGAKYWSDHLCLYNLVTQELRRIPRNKATALFDASHNYTESLVSVYNFVDSESREDQVVN